jgi:large subunit ribosomal protein L10
VPLTRNEKTELVAQVSEIVRVSQSVVIAEYRGLTVKQMTSLRSNAREQGVSLHVLKNTLVSRSIEGTPFQGIQSNLTGPLLYAFSADPVAPSKVLIGFAKSNERLVVKGGALPGVVMSLIDITKLASLPSKEVLLAQWVATIQFPVSGFVRTLSQIPTGFVRLLSAIKDAKAQ